MKTGNETGYSFSFLKRLGIGVHLVISSLAVLLIVVMVNYISARHFLRIDVTASKQWKLSPMTIRLLNSITNDIKAIVYFEKDNPMYVMTVSLLREYASINPLIKLELVNPTTDPAEAERVKNIYKLGQSSSKEVVIFDCEGQIKMVYANDLMDYEIEPTEDSSAVFRRKITAFKGESVFTSALIWVTQPRQLKVYFIQDHREHNLFSRDEIVGYSKFADLLSDMRLKPEPLSLLGSAEIPIDCSLLIAAAPLDPYTSDEIGKIERYLNHGGRMFILLNNNSVNKIIGLEKMLIAWGVVVGDNIVLDPTRQVPGSKGLALSLNNFGIHPITDPLINSTVHFLMPRSVSAIKSLSKQPDAPKVSELILTSENGLIINDIKDGSVRVVPGRTLQGYCSVAVAVEKGEVRGLTAGRGLTRIVVVGDSFFLANQMINSAANRDFAMLSLNWLLDRSELLGGIGPRTVKEYKLLLSQQQINNLRLMLLAVLPLSVIFIGFIVYIRRRK